MGTSSNQPAVSEKVFTVHIFPVSSKIVQFLSTTTMLEYESSSVQVDDSCIILFLTEDIRGASLNT